MKNSKNHNRETKQKARVRRVRVAARSQPGQELEEETPGRRRLLSADEATGHRARRPINAWQSAVFLVCRRCRELPRRQDNYTRLAASRGRGGAGGEAIRAGGTRGYGRAYDVSKGDS